MRLSQKGINNIRRGLKQSWSEGGSHRIKQQSTEIDADTIRKRLLDDCKGKLLLTGFVPSLGKVEVYRSTNRCDQFDVFLNGKKDMVGGPRILANWINHISSVMFDREIVG